MDKEFRNETNRCGTCSGAGHRYCPNQVTFYLSLSPLLPLYFFIGAQQNTLPPAEEMLVLLQVLKEPPGSRSTPINSTPPSRSLDNSSSPLSTTLLSTGVTQDSTEETQPSTKDIRTFSNGYRKRLYNTPVYDQPATPPPARPAQPAPPPPVGPAQPATPPPVQGMQCAGITQKQARCNSLAVGNSRFCAAHAALRTRKKRHLARIASYL